MLIRVFYLLYLILKPTYNPEQDVFEILSFHSMNLYNMALTAHEVLHLCLQLLSKQSLESFTILCKLLDTLMELVKCHLILQKNPAELWLIVDIGHFGEFVGRCEFCLVQYKKTSCTMLCNEPVSALSFLGTADVSFLSSSRRLGEMVRKSTPARALISPVYSDVSKYRLDFLKGKFLHYGKKHP